MKEIVLEVRTAGVRRQDRTCIGAPFAEDGEMRTGAQACRKFSRMRCSKESREDENAGEGRENGSRMDAPPRSPPDYANIFRGESRTRCEKTTPPNWLPKNEGKNRVLQGKPTAGGKRLRY